jgi:hypothetical protein
MTLHRSRVCHFVIDCDDLEKAVEFWSAALNAEHEVIDPPSGDVYQRLRLPDSDIRILLQRTADPKRSKERMHLDGRSSHRSTEPATYNLPKCQ